MPYEIRWATDAQTAIYISFGGGWQLDEWVDAEHNLKKMLSQVGHGVTVVMHIAEPRTFSMEVIGQIRSIVNMKHTPTDRKLLSWFLLSS